MIQRAFDERARVVGGTHAQWRVLAGLRRHPGIRQAPLAELFDVEPITMSRMIDRLQEGGFVERRADPQDRRAWLGLVTVLRRSLISLCHLCFERQRADATQI